KDKAIKPIPIKWYTKSPNISILNGSHPSSSGPNIRPKNPATIQVGIISFRKNGSRAFKIAPTKIRKDRKVKSTIKVQELFITHPPKFDYSIVPVMLPMHLAIYKLRF